MKYDPQIHHRRSIRLRGYNYSQAGAYFVTVCTSDGEHLLGEVTDGVVRLNEYGKMAALCWQWLARRYPNVDLDEWIVMPNHLHGIIVITDEGRRGGSARGGSRTAPTTAECRGGSRTAPTTAIKRKPLGRLIGAFKTISTQRINEIRNVRGARVWQRNYYEHIVRNEDELNKIREYIATNPLRWGQETAGAVREPW
ncbi:MAG TPA: transposase [Candidatus Acidoferrales bacterium]